MKTLLECVSGHRLEVLVKLAGYLGLRREEILALKWSNVNFEQQVIVITAARTSAGSKIVEKTTKTAASKRSLHMPEELATLLAAHKRKQEEYQAVLGETYCDEGYVFTHEDGRPFRPNYVSELFTDFIKKNNLPPLTLHGLRHTFATLGNSSGLTMYDIGKALGHSTTATTSKIYTHVIDQSHQNTIEKIADTLKNATEQD